MCNSYSCVANNEWAVCIQFHSTASLQAFPKTACQRRLGMGKGRVKGKRDLAKKHQHLVLWLWRVQTSWDLQEYSIILRKDRHDKDHCAKKQDDRGSKDPGEGACCKAKCNRGQFNNVGWKCHWLIEWHIKMLDACVSRFEFVFHFFSAKGGGCWKG